MPQSAKPMKLALSHAAATRPNAAIVALFIITTLWGVQSHAQGSRADYDRAASLSRRTSGKVFRDRVEAHWLTNNAQFWYEVKTGTETREFVLVDAEKGERKPAFDHAKLAEALIKAGVQDAKPDNLPLRNAELKSAAELSFTANGKSWRADLSSYSLTERKDVKETNTTVLSPDNIPTASRRTGPETSLTFINRTQAEVELFWLNTTGERQSYGKLAAGAQREQHTFAGHVWLAVNERGRTVAGFEAIEKASDAEISTATGFGTGRGRGGNRAGGAGTGGGFQRPQSRETSPDGKWRASIKDYNVVVKNVASGEETVFTVDGKSDDAYRERFFWSPNSKHLVAIRVEKGQEHKVSFIESSPRDQLQPKLVTFDYLKPGDKLPHPRPALFDVIAKKQIPVSDELFPNPFTESGNMEIRWERDSSRFTFRYNQRGHQVLREIAVEVPTHGEPNTSDAPVLVASSATEAARVSAVIDEQSKTFIDYSGKSFLERLDDTGELIWMSERDGWNHLYLYDAKTGRVKNQITKGEWIVRGVDRVDRDKRQIWFRAAGIHPGQDPYYIHYCRVNFDGSSLVKLTEGDGTHTVEFSPDRKFIIDSYSRVDLPTVTELRRADDGKLVCKLERGDMSALTATGWRAAERFVAKARDGATDIYGIIVRPTNIDPAKKYPVIESIYAGPQGSFTPKSFSAMPRMMELAELGFIVVQMDGMGTSNRSKKFHDVCWKNIGDAGFPDRVLWIKAAAAKHPEMDISRVGIYGTSAGGQNALGGLLTHGDFYKAGVSDCGCHDNRMDKIWWNEQWMGWPVGAHYDEQSNVTLAKNLQGKVLLMVGEMDRNVDPASTMQVCNALIKANKDFEFVVVPGAGHGVAGSPYGKRRLQDFFVRALHGKEPRW
jgi:dipeptidyl-peptidase 4